jgi:glutamate-1-semialdehyde aminotransferase
MILGHAFEPVVQAVIEKAKLGTCWDANRIRNPNRSFLAIPNE